MGYISHNALLVTTYKREHIDEAHAKAVEIFGGLVSAPCKSAINGYYSLAVFPDGSKEGWDTSDEYDVKREQFRAWLETHRFEDNSTWLDWVEVQYGNDDGETCIVADSDAWKRSS